MSNLKWIDKTLPQWLQTEREFQATRDRKMKVTLPRLKCLESDLRESEIAKSEECES